MLKTFVLPHLCTFHKVIYFSPMKQMIVQKKKTNAMQF
jgi:hypothetical protein